MKSKNTITLFLMFASIALLLVLQVLWLQNSYEKAFFDLRRDSNFLFRNTLFSIRDSLFLKNVKPLTWDSLPPASSVESVQLYKKRGADSMRINMKSSTVQVFVNSETSGSNDSILKALSPMVRHFNRPAQEGKSFVIRLEPDSIQLDTLTVVFAKALKMANLPVHFAVRHDMTSPDRIAGVMRTRANAGSEPVREIHPTLYRDSMVLDIVRINPISRYTATLTGFRGFIIKSIAPQIVFSLLLTLLTVAAFVILYRSLKAQQRLMELKNDFISNVTHELKTPVATVSVALEALKNFHALNDTKLTKEYLDIAQQELNRLTLMTDKILKASVFESKGIVMQHEQVDLAKTIQQVMESMKLVFEKHHAIATFLKEGDDFVIEGTQAHLTNVVYNLVDNALKYSPVDPNLMITLIDNSTSVLLKVQDHGLGIAPEYKMKIFEKFFRVPTGDIHNIKGYGLGLSYVASVVKGHGGNIDVVSEPGKGSTFILQLPKKSA